jgi:predicted signal transduction protein with EAL and GGDEF domain
VPILPTPSLAPWILSQLAAAPGRLTWHIDPLLGYQVALGNRLCITHPLMSGQPRRAPADIVARRAVDEFAIFLKRLVPERNGVNLNMGAVLDLSQLIWQGRSLSIGAGIGVAMLHPEMNDAAAWLAAANQAAYLAKRDGCGSVLSSQ